jgi:hypothetical protein
MNDDTPPAWAQAMEHRLGNLELTLLRRLGDMEGHLTAQQEGLRDDLLADHAAHIAGFGERIGRIRGDVLAHIDERTAGIMAWLDRLQEEPGAQAQGGVVVQGMAEMALRRNTTTREDLQELTDMVLAMHRRLQSMEAELRQLRGEGEGA